MKHGLIKVLPFGNALQEFILSRCLLLCVSEVDLPFDDEVFEEDEVILGLLKIDLSNPDLFLCGLKFVSCQIHLIVFLRHCLKTVMKILRYASLFLKDIAALFLARSRFERIGGIAV